ncbi:MAG TPA: LacI family DNA-binding transcriptional regulator [Rhizobium sp.]|nr:LacI family DNA-binding transcriptional regulator [Rhizobium sp.]
MPDTRQKLTIYDIAQLSGSSPSTVSAVLNGTWKKRRVGEATAKKIQEIAAEHGYTTNLQARGLRRAQSGLVGLILPVHDNRFFASMSQSFEAQARERGWCPVIVSTLRNPVEEIRTVETLISYAVDYLFIAGVTDPAALSEICRAAQVPHIYVDLPGKDAPSVVSNNYLGAELLTRKLLELMPRVDDAARAKPYLIGGLETDFASAHRISAFRSTVLELCGSFDDDQIITCGYAPESAAREVSALCDRLGGLPAGLFVNSIRAFEGIVSEFVHLPSESFEQSVFGCYDYDPFAAFLQFPVHMVRQNSNQLIATAFNLVDRGFTDPVLIQVDPELIPPRTVYSGPFSQLG